MVQMMKVMAKVRSYTYPHYTGRCTIGGNFASCFYLSQAVLYGLQREKTLHVKAEIVGLPGKDLPFVADMNRRIGKEPEQLLHVLMDDSLFHQLPPL